MGVGLTNVPELLFLAIFARDMLNDLDSGRADMKAPQPILAGILSIGLWAAPLAGETQHCPPALRRRPGPVREPPPAPTAASFGRRLPHGHNDRRGR